jgi:hypothetical protein
MFKSVLFSLLIGLILLSPAFAVDKSLILYLPLDEGSGDTVKDVSNYGNIGKTFGNVKWAEGKAGKCLELVAGSYVEMPEIPQYDVTDAVSLMAWVNTTTVTSWARLIDKSQWQDNGYDLVLHADLHFPMLEFFVNNTTSQVQAKTRVDDGKWHFVIGTFGNKALKVYVDGIQEGEVTSVNNVDIKPNDWPVRIGCEANTSKGQQYLGMIDEIAMYDRELSADEISRIFQNGINIATVESHGKLASTWASLKADK